MKRPSEIRSGLASFRKEAPEYYNNQLLLDIIKKLQYNNIIIKNRLNGPINLNGINNDKKLDPKSLIRGINESIIDYGYVSYSNDFEYYDSYKDGKYTIFTQKMNDYYLSEDHYFNNMLYNINYSFIPVYRLYFSSNNEENNTRNDYIKDDIECNYIKVLQNSKKYNKYDFTQLIQIMDLYFKEVYKNTSNKIKNIFGAQNLEYYKLIVNNEYLVENLNKYNFEPFYSILTRIQLPVKIYNKIKKEENIIYLYMRPHITFFPFLGECMIVSSIGKNYKKGYYGLVPSNIHVYTFHCKYNSYNEIKSNINKMINEYIDIAYNAVQENIDGINNMICDMYNIEKCINYKNDTFMLLDDPCKILMGNLFDYNLIRIADNNNKVYTLGFLNKFYDKEQKPKIINKISDIKEFREKFILDYNNNITDIKYSRKNCMREFKEYVYDNIIDEANCKIYSKINEIIKYMIDMVNRKFNFVNDKFSMIYNQYKIYIQSVDINGINITINLPESYYDVNKYIKYDKSEVNDEIFARIRICKNRKNIIDSIGLHCNYHKLLTGKSRVALKDIKKENIYWSKFTAYNKCFKIINKKHESNNHDMYLNHEHINYISKEPFYTELKSFIIDYLYFIFNDVLKSDQFIDYMEDMYNIFEETINNNIELSKLKDNAVNENEKYKHIINDIGKDTLNKDSNNININEYENISDFFLEISYYIEHFNVSCKRLCINDK